MAAAPAPSRGSVGVSLPSSGATGGGSDSSREFASKLKKAFNWRNWQKFLVDNFLPVGFLVALILALAWPLPGRTIAKWEVKGIRVVQGINNFLVFLVSGLTLRTEEFRALKKHWLAVVYGLLSILFVTPLLGFGTRELPLHNHAFAVGLTIFCAVPTTLGVGVALVSAAKGNQALALLLTVSTNALGIVVMPYSLKLLLSSSNSVRIDPLDLFVKLIITVLLPTILGKVLRSSSASISAWVTRHKVGLSIFSSTNLIIIVWQTLCAAQKELLKQRPTDIVVVILLSCAMHILYLNFNGIVVLFLRLPLKEAIAVVIMSSQKSAPVAVAVITFLTRDLTLQGLYSIPCVIGQLCQIFIGSLLVRFCAKMVEKKEERELFPGEVVACE